MELPIRLPYLSLSWKGKPWKPLDHKIKNDKDTEQERASLDDIQPSPAPGILQGSSWWVQWRNCFPIFFPDHFPRLALENHTIHFGSRKIMNFGSHRQVSTFETWLYVAMFQNFSENPVLNHRMERGTAGYRRPPTFCRSARCCNPFARTSGDDQSEHGTTSPGISFFSLRKIIENSHLISGVYPNFSHTHMRSTNFICDPTIFRFRFHAERPSHRENARVLVRHVDTGPVPYQGMGWRWVPSMNHNWMPQSGVYGASSLVQKRLTHTKQYPQYDQMEQFHHVSPLNMRKGLW